jgi:hypothetical protein
MVKSKKLPRAGLASEIWILPHSEYSCKGYYVAERFPSGKEYHLNGQVYTDDLCFWLLSGRQVLSEYQAKQVAEYRRSLGEEVTEVWASALPTGARWLNLR